MMAELQTTEWQQNESDEAYWRWEKATRRRLRRTYGAEGLALIAELVDRGLAGHPGMPEQDAWAWAEGKYERGEVLC
jgi:hypothetical protein